MSPFDHETPFVYQVAIEFVTLANDAVERLPRGRAYLADYWGESRTRGIIGAHGGSWQGALMQAC